MLLQNAVIPQKVLFLAKMPKNCKNGEGTQKFTTPMVFTRVEGQHNFCFYKPRYTTGAIRLAFPHYGLELDTLLAVAGATTKTKNHG